MGQDEAAHSIQIIGMSNSYRGQALESQLSSQGLRWSRVDGVDVTALPESPDTYVDQASARILLRREVLDGEIGCALAHKDAYSLLLASHDQFSIILEDDARLIGNIEIDLIGSILRSQIPRILLLRTNRSTAIVERKPIEIHGVDTARAYLAIVPPTSTTGYAVNRAAAELLLRNGRRVTHVADWPVHASVMTEFYILSPPIVEHDSAAQSAIGQRTTGSPNRHQTRLRWIRRIRGVLHITWFVHGALYGNYRTYVVHEFLRMPAYLWASRRAGRLIATDPESPAVAPPIVSALLRFQRT